MTLRSHTYEEILSAFNEEETVYRLITNSGNDDILIGDIGEIERNIYDYLDGEKPKDWKLRRITRDEFVYRYSFCNA